MNKLKRENLPSLIYSQISRMIINNDLKPGDKVNKKELAEILGVSQTPVQEAIIRLLNEGIIEQNGKQGYYVKKFTDQDMKNIFAVRAALESISIRLCMEADIFKQNPDILNIFDRFSFPLKKSRILEYQAADRNFHESILMMSNNPIIIDFVKNFEFVQKCYQKGLIRPPDETISEHKEILDAIKKGDREKASSLLLFHHLKTRDAINEKHISH